jgi:pimeloyl-ACP methyl ester carboxylesterase
VVVKDVGHIMYLEKPAEFNRLVIGFIEQNKDGE